MPGTMLPPICVIVYCPHVAVAVGVGVGVNVDVAVGVNVAVGVAVAVDVAVTMAVAVGVDVAVAVAVGVNVAVTVAVGVGLGQVRVYRTFKPFVSVAVPHEKVLAGPVALACTPVVSSLPKSLVNP